MGVLQSRCAILDACRGTQWLIALSRSFVPAWPAYDDWPLCRHALCLPYRHQAPNSLLAPASYRVRPYGQLLGELHQPGRRNSPLLCYRPIRSWLGFERSDPPHHSRLGRSRCQHADTSKHLLELPQRHRAGSWLWLYAVSEILRYLPASDQCPFPQAKPQHHVH